MIEHPKTELQLRVKDRPEDLSDHGPKSPRTRMIILLWTAWGLVFLGYLWVLKEHPAPESFSVERNQQSFTGRSTIEPSNR